VIINGSDDRAIWRYDHPPPAKEAGPSLMSQ
jgi:hypothetical protein